MSVDPYGSRGSDAVAMEEQHDLADDLLFGPAGDDLSCTLGADAGHFAQTRRLLLDNFEHLLAEGTGELPGIDRADAADHAGAQVLLDALDRRRCRDLEERGPELHAVNAVVHPGAARLDKLAGRNGRGVTEYCYEVPLAARLHAQHAKPVLLIVECDAFDEAGEDLCGRACRRSLSHGHPPNVRKCSAETSRISRPGLRFRDRLHNPIQRPASLTTAFTLAGESREAAC